MRILHVISSLQVGGAERFVIDLAAQQALSHSICILSMSWPGETLQAEAEGLGLSVVCIPNSGVISQLREVRRLCRDFDIVHIHSSYALPRIMLATRWLGSKPELIYTRHNEMVLDGFKWQLTYGLASRWVKQFVFVSAQAQARFLSYYPKARDRSVTVLNGVAPLIRHATKRQGLHLGHVGRFVPLKSQHLLVESAALLSSDIQQDLTLHFFGTGPELESVQSLASKYTDKFACVFHGHQTDRTAIYSTFDVLVVTSETEGLSLAVIEALACKMPVIASNVGGNSELVKHQGNGLLYGYADTQALAEQIKALWASPELINQYGDSGFNIYTDSFSIKACEANYLKVYS